MNRIGFRFKEEQERETFEGEVLWFCDCLAENLLAMETKEWTQLLIELHKIIYGDRIAECLEE